MHDSFLMLNIFTFCVQYILHVLKKGPDKFEYYNW